MDSLVIRKEVNKSFPVHKRQEKEKKIINLWKFLIPHDNNGKLKKNVGFNEFKIQVIDVEI